jgi:hypothetical protein
MHYIDPVVIIVDFVHGSEVHHAQKYRYADSLDWFEAFVNSCLMLQVLDKCPYSPFPDEGITVGEQYDSK